MGGVPRQEPTQQPRIISPAACRRALANFGLTQLYTFASLAAGLRPNGGQKPPARMCARWWRAAPVA